MKSIGRIVIRLGIAIVTSVLICSPLPAMTTIDFQVVDLRGVPRFRDPVYLAIRTRNEWISFTTLRGERPATTTNCSRSDFDPHSTTAGVRD
jgi:hypothetical protein